MKRMNKVMMMFVSGAMIVAAGSAFARGNNRGGPGGDYSRMSIEDRRANRAEMHKRMKQVHGKMMREEVGLDEKTAVKLEKRMEKHREEAKKWREQMLDGQDALRKLLQADSNNQKAYARHLSKIKQAQQKMHDMRQAEFKYAQGLLTPKQQTKMLRAFRLMHHKRGEFMRNHRRGGPGRGWGPGDGVGSGRGMGPGGGMGAGRGMGPGGGMGPMGFGE